MQKPLLLLDCYLDEGGCPALFHPPAGVPAKVLLAPHIPVAELSIDLSEYAGLVITGSAASVLDEAAWSLALEQLLRDAQGSGLPVLGVCYGHQLIAKALFGNGQVRRSATPEFGWYEIEVTVPLGPVSQTPSTFLSFVSHYDEVSTDPCPGLQILARSERCGVQALRHESAPIWGVQFHAEMDFGEASSIFLERIGNSPELGIDAEEMLAKAKSTGELWQAIYGCFLSSL